MCTDLPRSLIPVSSALDASGKSLWSLFIDFQENQSWLFTVPCWCQQNKQKKEKIKEDANLGSYFLLFAGMPLGQNNQRWTGIRYQTKCSQTLSWGGAKRWAENLVPWPLGMLKPRTCMYLQNMQVQYLQLSLLLWLPNPGRHVPYQQNRSIVRAAPFLVQPRHF